MNLDEIPVIETERLRLRVQRAGDLAASEAMWGSPEVVRYISGKPSSRFESWARLLRNVGHWTLLGYGYWRVEERATGSFVGEVGLANFERGLEPSLDGIPEIGWALAPDAQGRGFATEAVGAAVAWADANLPYPRTACLIAPENVASLRIARKNGYRDWTETRFRGEPVLLLDRVRPS